MNAPSVLVISKVWRSEFVLLINFVVLSILSIVISHVFPSTIITGTLFTTRSWRAEMAMPLLSLLPIGTLLLAIFRIYNVRYVLSSRGIDCYDWVLGPQSVMSVRYEDIRSLETKQSLIGRMLDVGDVLIGTAAQSNVEVIFKGVASPGEVLHLIQRERDRRHQMDSPSYQE